MAKTNPAAAGNKATQAQPPATATPADDDLDQASQAQDDDLDQQAQAPAGKAAEPEPKSELEPQNIVPENRGNYTAMAKELLLYACGMFGVDPSADARPRQLLAWTFYPGDVLDSIPPAVVIVTGGGKKLKVFEDQDTYPLDQDTEERLADIFGAYGVDPTTKLPVRKPLPEDLTLPLIHVTGVSTKTDHRYRGGYLRSGGKVEAARRAAKR